MDPPEHTRIRRLAADPFATWSIERLRPRIERITSVLLDNLIAAGPPVDLIARFYAPLTFTAQCELLGIPEAHRSTIRTCYSAALSSHPGATWEVVQAGELQLYTCMTKVLADKRRRPGTGLCDRLIDARDRHDLVDEAELHGVATPSCWMGPFSPRCRSRTRYGVC